MLRFIIEIRKFILIYKLEYLSTLEYIIAFLFLLWSEIRSEGSIAIVKKFDLDFCMIFGSTSLTESKNVF